LERFRQRESIVPGEDLRFFPAVIDASDELARPVVW